MTSVLIVVGLVVEVLVIGGGGQPPRPHSAAYGGLRAAFTAPAGFTAATPDGPCVSALNMQCWTTSALPTAAVDAAVKELGADYRTTDSSWCGAEHWAAQRKAWGEARVPCTVYGTWRGLQVIVAAIASPDPKASRPGRPVFLPTLVSVTAT